MANQADDPRYDDLLAHLADYETLRAAARSVVDWAKPTAAKGKYAPYVLIPVQVLDVLRDALAATAEPDVRGAAP